MAVWTEARATEFARKVATFRETLDATERAAFDAILATAARHARDTDVQGYDGGSGNVILPVFGDGSVRFLNVAGGTNSTDGTSDTLLGHR